MYKERWTKREEECCCYFPWSAALSAGVAIAGMVVWLIFARRAFDATNLTIDNLQIVRPTELQYVSTGMLVLAITFGVCCASALLISMWRGSIRSHVDSEGQPHPNSRMYVVVNTLLNIATSLVLLLVVLLLAAFCVWAASALALDKGAGAAAGIASQAQGLVKDFVGLGKQFLTFYDSFQQDIKSTLTALGPQASDVTNIFTKLDNEIGKLKGPLLESACPTWCLNLQSVAFIKGDRCICEPAVLSNASKTSADAWKALIPTIIGMVAMCVGAYCVAMALMSHNATTRTEMSLWNRMPIMASPPHQVTVASSGHGMPLMQGPGYGGQYKGY